MKLYPVKFECLDETGEVVFTLKCFDDMLSELEMRQAISSDSWLEISALIHDGLKQMHNGGPPF